MSHRPVRDRAERWTWRAAQIIWWGTDFCSVWDSVEKPQRRRMRDFWSLFLKWDIKDISFPHLILPDRSSCPGAPSLTASSGSAAAAGETSDAGDQESHPNNQTTECLCLSRGVSPPSRLRSLHTMRERSDRSARHRRERRVGRGDTQDCSRISGRGCSLLTNQMAAQKDGGWGRS